jgi:hypothetical protein
VPSTQPPVDPELDVELRELVRQNEGVITSSYGTEENAAVDEAAVGKPPPDAE